MKKYLLSSDNGYHWNTNIMFDSIEDAVIYHVNECIDEYMYEWTSILISKVERPYYDKSSINVTILTVDSYVNTD